MVSQEQVIVFRDISVTGISLSISSEVGKFVSYRTFTEPSWMLTSAVYEYARSNSSTFIFARNNMQNITLNLYPNASQFISRLEVV